MWCCDGRKWRRRAFSYLSSVRTNEWGVFLSMNVGLTRHGDPLLNTEPGSTVHQLSPVQIQNVRSLMQRSTFMHFFLYTPALRCDREPYAMYSAHVLGPWGEMSMMIRITRLTERVLYTLHPRSRKGQLATFFLPRDGLYNTVLGELSLIHSPTQNFFQSLPIRILRLAATSANPMSLSYTLKAR